MRPAVPCQPSSVCAPTTTDAPSSASRSAVAAPILRCPPATIAILPSSLRMRPRPLLLQTRLAGNAACAYSRSLSRSRDRSGLRRPAEHVVAHRVGDAADLGDVGIADAELLQRRRQILDHRVDMGVVETLGNEMRVA